MGDAKGKRQKRQKNIPTINILPRRKHRLRLPLPLQEPLQVQKLPRNNLLLQMRQPALVKGVDFQLQQFALLGSEGGYPFFFVKFTCYGCWVWDCTRARGSVAVGGLTLALAAGGRSSCCGCGRRIKRTAGLGGSEEGHDVAVLFGLFGIGRARLGGAGFAFEGGHCSGCVRWCFVDEVKWVERAEEDRRILR